MVDDRVDGGLIRPCGSVQLCGCFVRCRMIVMGMG